MIAPFNSRAEADFPPTLRNIAPFQLTFLVWIFVLAIDFFSTKATMNAGLGSLETPIRQLLFYGGQFAVIGLLVAALPTFRAAIPLLFALPKPSIGPGLFMLALGVALCWATGIYAMLVVFPCIHFWPELASEFWKYSAIPIAPSLAQIVLTIIAACLFAPIAEELLIRGLLFGALKDKFKPFHAVIISSIIFGAFHYRGIVVTSVIGVIYALIAIRYRSLLASMLLHVVYNTIVTIPWFLNIFFAKDPATAANVSNWIPEIVMAIAGIPLTVLFIRRLRTALA